MAPRVPKDNLARKSEIDNKASAIAILIFSISNETLDSGSLLSALKFSLLFNSLNL